MTDFEQKNNMKTQLFKTFQYEQFPAEYKFVDLYQVMYLLIKNLILEQENMIISINQFGDSNKSLYNFNNFELDNLQIEVYEKWQKDVKNPKHQISALKKQLYINNILC